MASLYSNTLLDYSRGKQEFRLVKLQHSKAEERIRCDLSTHSFAEEHPAYIALSYAWGKKERHDDIELNGSLLPVGESLWRFLDEMRQQHLLITFWIDALCIDQQNVLEINNQVQMMRKIYSNAHSVWIWLGVSDTSAHSDTGMEYLASRIPLNPTSGNLSKFWTPRQARSVLALFTREYWRRIWVVQEIMHAKRAAVLCGSKKVSWKALRELVNDLWLIEIRGRASHVLGVSHALSSPAVIIIDAKTEWKKTSKSLAQLVEQYRHQLATDIRDKVYALHGLANDSDNIEVDYRKDAKDLFVEIVYYACSMVASNKDARQARKTVSHIGRVTMQTLKVHCTPEELDFHISVARGEGVERPSTAVRRPDEILPTTAPPLNIFGPVEPDRRDASTYITPSTLDDDIPDQRLTCLFDFLDCTYTTITSKREWKMHHFAHFQDQEPPTFLNCPYCDDPLASTFSYSSGWEALNARLNHHVAEHVPDEAAGQTPTVRKAPESLIYYDMWQKGTISNDKFEELEDRHGPKEDSDELSESLDASTRLAQADAQRQAELEQAFRQL